MSAYAEYKGFTRIAKQFRDEAHTARERGQFHAAQDAADKAADYERMAQDSYYAFAEECERDYAEEFGAWA